MVSIELSNSNNSYDKLMKKILIIPTNKRKKLQNQTEQIIMKIIKYLLATKDVVGC